MFTITEHAGERRDRHISVLNKTLLVQQIVMRFSRPAVATTSDSAVDMLGHFVHVNQIG
jgi:hypothetical protein